MYIWPSPKWGNTKLVAANWVAYMEGKIIFESKFNIYINKIKI
jgi:hypothetical protein